ncbi:MULTISPECIES: pantoate--beta-alanine ligase [Halomonadaceae]|uniref:pantoate--beta-alanine ligase n=1 Tax=Halomonadaceae TaxID=28256 RepID=UPI00158284AD|nr:MULTISPECIES: pantoate--beta-alanine ligase [Halomonas]MDI4636511.1 pantoate--beta-alanine ligase [Halomonas sp. BMC7]NUJ60876.1 pantoate--beta-alanine ligase [Halomonas taeanensis]|tara:strand:- start:2119 stop:2979 length:861 start_codon:yes stop_codon:yes gene_type:complete
MDTLHHVQALRKALAGPRRAGQRIALVPTMGNLHAGHLALVAEARARADLVVATIFVNPLQFGPDEDLDAYPRTLDEDQVRLANAGCDLLFAPSTRELYPEGLGVQTRVRVAGVSEGLCGGSRPGHFDGVATVVSLLFNLVQPDLACFGEKDYQQLAVIRQLTRDLHFPIEIVGVPIVRAEDGLALSSRNGYLSEEERIRAPGLHLTLCELRDAIAAGTPVADALAVANDHLVARGFVTDYLALRRADDLGEIDADTREAVILAAAQLGPARLIDNLTVSLSRRDG